MHIDGVMPLFPYMVRMFLGVYGFVMGTAFFGNFAYEKHGMKRVIKAIYIISVGSPTLR